MKRWFFMVIAAILFTGLVVTPSMAKGKDGKGPKGPSGPAGKSNVGHLYLYEKDLEWNIVEGGMWGKMKYNLTGPTFDFVFNGHGLPIGQDFTLIYYPDPDPGVWPVSGIICLGYGTVMGDCEDTPCNGGGGSIHIQGSYDSGDLPKEYDNNFGEGAKIWLVPSEDVTCDGENSEIFGWSPDAILFEGDLITYKKAEDVDEE